MCTSTSARVKLSSVQHVHISGVSLIGCGENTLSINGDTIEIRNTFFYQNTLNRVESVNTLIVEDSVFDRGSSAGLYLRTIVNSATIQRRVFSNNGRSGITAESADLENQ